MSTRRFFSLHPVIDNQVPIAGDELHHLKRETAAISIAAILSCTRTIGNNHACSEDLPDNLVKASGKK